VPALFEVETHPTVFQMTSTIAATLPPATSFAELLRALFPCGSITGAPKQRTMQLIAGLESAPRGLYTGAIGWVDAPDATAACGDFCLSVAIRTLVLGAPRLDPVAGLLRPGSIGIGAGIVIDSRAEEEYEECRLKARFLTGLDPGFALIETLHATRDEGIRHLERHLARLAASAGCLGFGLPLAQIRLALDAQRRALPAATAFRLRLTLHPNGRFDIAAAPLDALAAGPVTLLLAETAVDGKDPLLRHKTTWRVDYDAAVAEAVRRGAFDMLFCNRDGFLTEGGRSNLFVRLDGEWLTPPLAAGVLPGVMRSMLLQDPAWRAREAWLRPADLARAERLLVCNALRGALDARLAR
jgi:para-aminobenzoate synthetase/4-amino-4-deoxychorismate lyase